MKNCSHLVRLSENMKAAIAAANENKFQNVKYVGMDGWKEHRNDQWPLILIENGDMSD